MDSEELGDKILKQYSPVHEDVDEALIKMSERVDMLQTQVTQLEKDNARLEGELKLAHTQRNTLAMLASDEPKFFNPLGIMAAKSLRDAILAEGEDAE